MKMRQTEDLIRQDWHVKLHQEGKTITAEMGKPTFKSQKKFMEEVEEKLKTRNEVLAKIQQVRIDPDE